MDSIMEPGCKTCFVWGQSIFRFTSLSVKRFTTRSMDITWN